MGDRHHLALDAAIFMLRTIGEPGRPTSAETFADDGYFKASNEGCGAQETA